MLFFLHISLLDFAPVLIMAVAHKLHFHLLSSFLLLLLHMKPALVLNASVGGGRVQCIEWERQALLKIKDEIIDDYGHLSSWRSEDKHTDCCKWRGIRCSNQTGHITGLDLHVTESCYLHDRSFRGKVSDSLLELQHLNYLDLSCNDFHGTLFPNFNGSLSKLRYLNISHAGFAGTLSYQFGNLTSLHSLDLSYNEFSNAGNLEWIFHFSSLDFLDLSGNDLSRGKDWLQIPHKVPSLTSLHLSDCGLDHIIPSSTSGLNSSTSIAILDLSSNSFTSSVFQWVTSFKGSLVDLDLSFNIIEGFIPPVLENLTYLVNLDLSSNKLEGVIPSFFRNFCNLHSLDLSFNFLKGRLALLFEHLSVCTGESLEILRLGANEIHGSLPSITRFSSLKELSLYGNQLQGSLLETFRQPSHIVVLDLSGNQLTGSLPDFSALPSLNELRLSDNQFNGTIPESIGLLSDLEILSADHNSLQGLVSEAHFSNVSKLRELTLSRNSLSLKFNSTWLPFFQLDVISLGSCKLGPSFPQWLQTQNNYSELDISDAGIADSVPNWLWDLSPRIHFLNISHNNMTGVVPDLSSKFHGDYIRIDLSSNLLEGPLPPLPSNLFSLDLSQNRFMGSVSFICDTWPLVFLDLSGNLFSGALSHDCFMNGQTTVILNMADNNVSGEIPTSVGALPGLYTLNLRNNSFSGGIPLSLKNCSYLNFLDLGGNKLSGKIPAWIGESLLSMAVLSLQSNEFYGSIPVELCQLTNILILDLSVNAISGTIPQCFQNFTMMSGRQSNNTYGFLHGILGNGDAGGYTDNAMVKWKGRTYQYDKYIPILRIIDLAGNRLHGQIPEEVTSLLELVGLNLSNNRLTGIIPQKIGQLKQLQSLDLSQNLLSGEVPGSLAELTFLSYLNLSYNHLTGRIPTGTQLQSFDPSAFTGNLALCGLPLPQKCPGDETPGRRPTSATQDNQETADDEFWKWFYVSMAVGFIIFFWGVSGTLLLKRSWRHAYFQLLDKFNDWLHVTLAVQKARLLHKMYG